MYVAYTRRLCICKPSLLHVSLRADVLILYVSVKRVKELLKFDASVLFGCCAEGALSVIV